MGVSEHLPDTKGPIDNGESQTGSRTDLELPALTGTTERKLMAKIDWHILPWLCILYLLAFLDRVNISNAAILGLKEDLDIVSGTKYNTALTIFFVPYIICEIPSNILLKKLKPHVWLSGCMFMFGMVLVFQGLVQNWGGLMATRFFLGVFETGMFPGCFYLLGMWYTRSEAQKRFSFFFSSTTLAGAFGGLLASGIGKMDGICGYRGWRWVFILEGILTCVVSIILFFLIADFPEDVKWLTEEERTYVRAKLAKDVGKAAHNVHMGKREVLGVFKDYKVFIGGFMYFGLIVPAYGYAYFAPTIIQSYGYDPIKTQFYSIPPWAAAFGFSMVIAYCSDKLRHRFAFTLFPMAVALAGFAMLMTIHGNTNAQYASLFLVTSGCYSAMPVIVCWFAMNLGGHHRRSVGTAWQVGFGNIGGIISTYSFVTKDGVTDYRTGYIICLSFVCLSAVSCAAYLLALWLENKKRDRSPVDPAMIPEEEEEYLGDLAPTYRYTY
ncbi:Major facilitator superfamily domain general substrate transporter [Penicillium bovifimosum]|uniref:Major facilitator superfamily domain general substrate transporter n=1 Tax=Penicillium bovifimosum TaxID=126998 RepID=A0A9W9HHE7_9EURO|nr:Major facilitator superfamily domain general substrate transporter [Penicillium bovifimosum]KAJ5145920.1 Major facilitator superfamily domain general substrate transporter [Penicillium bovifimosum]